MSQPAISEGEIDFRVGEETFKTWFHVVGEIKSRRPLVVLHGGPGSSHSYVLSIADLTSTRGVPVIFYDQLGGGRSTHLRDKPSDFWKPELFMDELENLLAHFGIAQDYDLLGHSWGGMLAAQFAATRLPTGLKRLIISSSPASMKIFEEGAKTLIAQLPQEVQDSLSKHEQAGTTDSEEYKSAMEKFYDKHLCRIKNIPEVEESFKDMDEDYTVYNTMNGPSEFHITGSLKTWNIIDIVHRISMPALLLNGRYDEVTEKSVLPFFEKIPKVKWVIFENSSHMAQWEERERYMQVVGDFLTVN